MLELPSFLKQSNICRARAAIVPWDKMPALTNPDRVPAPMKDQTQLRILRSREALERAFNMPLTFP